MIARSYKKADYSILCQWLRERGLEPIPANLLPDKNGVVIDNVLFGFLYESKPIAFMENFVSNPAASKDDVDTAMLIIEDIFKTYCKEQGIIRIFALTNVPTIQARLVSKGYQRLGKIYMFKGDV